LIFIAVLIGIVLTFYGIPIATDAPFLVTGTNPAAFWLGLSLHVLAGEWWIRTTPDKTG
jgi:hypothetical protein